MTAAVLPTKALFGCRDSQRLKHRRQPLCPPWPRRKVEMQWPLDLRYKEECRVAWLFQTSPTLAVSLRNLLITLNCMILCAANRKCLKFSLFVLYRAAIYG